MGEAAISFHGNPAQLRGAISLPASKSISNRALIIAALSQEAVLLHNLSQAEDTRIIQRALDGLIDDTKRQIVDVRDAGTAFRFMTALLASREGNQFLLKGTERMHQRPVADLANALRSIGADISYKGEDGFPPLLIKGKKLPGGRTVINGNVSSQFISALCLIAPLLQHGLVLEIRQGTVSQAYIHMTLQLMESFGLKSEFADNRITIRPQTYRGGEFRIENDWSSASFFYAMAMIGVSADIDFESLHEKSIQGDSIIRELATVFGIHTHFSSGKISISKVGSSGEMINQHFDLNAYPDLAIPLIVACGVRYPSVTFSGLQHLQYKESDRLAVLSTELAKAGILLQYENDVLCFDNTGYKPSNTSYRFCTHQDHRIAMSLAMLALEGYTVILDDADCVAKSFPGFFAELNKLGFKYERS